MSEDQDMPGADDSAAGNDTPPWPGRRVQHALRLTGFGIWWEALARAFWPAAALALLVLAVLSFGAMRLLPEWSQPFLSAGLLLFMMAALLRGGLRFRRPAAGAALQRVDASLPGRPLSALNDLPALGGDGALWRAHLMQMAEHAGRARAVPPDAGLTRRDPFALRLVALTATAMALLFGSAGDLGQGLAALAPMRADSSAGDAVAPGLGWEGWAAPPPYTRRLTIYLNAQPEGAVLDLPEGSVISLRLYGEETRVTQDIGIALPGDDPRAPEFRVERPGDLQIGERRFRIAVRADDAPNVVFGPPAERRADGQLVQPFTAGDDYGVMAGQAEITLDIDRIERRHGLAVAPEQREALTLRLPLRGARAQVSAELTADLKKHAWANLPVKIRLQVEDGIGQSGRSEPLAMDLPGRRFFEPLAAALIELRRDLLWSRRNAPRSAQLLRAILWHPQGFIDAPILRDLRSVAVGLASDPLSDLQRDALAEALWRIAVELEDGGLEDARERMRRAQDKLAQAMRRGASPDEIRNLMEELRRATDDYLDRLAEQGQNNPADRFDRSPTQMMSGDQIQQMMDEIQRLMNEGRMAEAQALLEQFNRMMENMQVRRTEGGEGGSGRDSGGRMAETLREQQKLADQAFRQMQDEWLGLDAERDGSGGDEEAGGDGLGRDPQDLAGQQRMLRDDLGMQRGLLPERGTPEGEAAGEAMDRAGHAMRQAEQALRQGDLAEALNRQAEAIEALREGIRALGRGQRQRAGEQGGDEGAGNPDAEAQGPAGSGRDRAGQHVQRRDPLGRALQGQGGGIATDDPLAETEDGGNRARDLQDEIRRRLGERNRPQAERDYLDRLIEPF